MSSSPSSVSGAAPTLVDAHGRETWASWTLDQRLAHIATDLSGIGMRVYRDAIDAARRLLAAAYSAPSAASPEAIRCATCGRECEPINESDAPVTHCVECAPPIPSREDARDAARLDWLQAQMAPKDSYVEVFLAGLRHGDADASAYQVEAQPLRWPTVQGETLRDAIDRAMSAVSHPEAQTNDTETRSHIEEFSLAVCPVTADPGCMDCIEGQCAGTAMGPVYITAHRCSACGGDDVFGQMYHHDGCSFASVPVQGEPNG